MLRNHRWPGALTVYQQGTFFNIYLGNGQKDFIVNKTIALPNQVEEVCRTTEEADPDPEQEKRLLAQEQPEETADE